MFCGWDWGSTHHGVCVIDNDGAIIARWMVPHSDVELAGVLAELAALCPPEHLPVAIERGEGLVVELLGGIGHPVLMVDPASFKAARPRWGSAGAKSDRGDAYMLADYARTDGHPAPPSGSCCSGYSRTWRAGPRPDRRGRS